MRTIAFVRNFPTGTMPTNPRKGFFSFRSHMQINTLKDRFEFTVGNMKICIEGYDFPDRDAVHIYLEPGTELQNRVTRRIDVIPHEGHLVVVKNKP